MKSKYIYISFYLSRLTNNMYCSMVSIDQNNKTLILFSSDFFVLGT